MAPDAPIRTAAQDALRRVGFADRIAATLSGPALDEGRVLAIRGGWGFGKSSLKNLVIERLGWRPDRADWLEFNPWQWGDADAIARALFGQIADKLGGEYSSSAARRAATLRRYGAILTSAEAPLKAAGAKTRAITAALTSASVVAAASAIGFDLPSAARVALGLGVLSFAAPAVGKLLNHLGRDRAAEPLDVVRRSLERSLRELARPLVVFVDDIDRLEPDQIRLLFRQVKVNANLPNIVFVLLFQPSIVEKALDPIANGEGRAFLEKIVQTNFDLPAVSPSVVHRIFTEQLSGVAGRVAKEENGFQQVRWGNVLIGCMQPYVRNLRDARRLLSSIAVHLPLHEGDGAFEVNVIDFMAIETLRVFEPDLHGALFNERDLLLQAGRHRQDGQDQANRARIEGLVGSVPEARRQAARGALSELFPRIAHVFGGNHFGDGWGERWLADKRVCTSRYFARYFELQTAEGEISEGEFVALLDASGDEARLAATLGGLEEQGLLPSIAARFDESVDRLPVASAPVLLPAMFSLGQKLAGRRTADPFNSPWVSAWRAVSWYVGRLPVDERGPSALDALKRSGALSVGAILIHLNDPADRKGDRDERPPDFDAVSLRRLKEEWLLQVRALAERGGLVDQPDLVSHLYRWRDYTGSLDEPRAWVAAATQDDAGFAILISRAMSRGTAHGWGDRVATPHETFNRETIEDFIGIEEASARVEVIEVGALAEEKRHALDVLRRHLDQWRKAQPDPAQTVEG